MIPRPIMQSVTLLMIALMNVNDRFRIRRHDRKLTGFAVLVECLGEASHDEATVEEKHNQFQCDPSAGIGLSDNDANLGDKGTPRRSILIFQHPTS